jgi:hypothetical protein
MARYPGTIPEEPLLGGEKTQDCVVHRKEPDQVGRKNKKKHRSEKLRKEKLRRIESQIFFALPWGSPAMRSELRV